MSFKLHKLKGLTIAELLVTLALTTVCLTLAYTTLTYIQKLFYNYKENNRFINEFVYFKSRMDYEALNSSFIIEKNENVFEIECDSSLTTIELKESVVLCTKNNHTDTFHFKINDVQKLYEKMNSPVLSNVLVNYLSFKLEYNKQQFTYVLNKQHDSSVKMKLEQSIANGAN